MSKELEPWLILPLEPVLVCLAGGALLSSVVFGALPILAVAAGCLVTAALLSTVQKMLAEAR